MKFSQISKGPKVKKTEISHTTLKYRILLILWISNLLANIQLKK